MFKSGRWTLESAWDPARLLPFASMTRARFEFPGDQVFLEDSEGARANAAAGWDFALPSLLNIQTFVEHESDDGFLYVVEDVAARRDLHNKPADFEQLHDYFGHNILFFRKRPDHPVGREYLDQPLARVLFRPRVVFSTHKEQREQMHRPPFSAWVPPKMVPKYQIWDVRRPAPRTTRFLTDACPCRERQRRLMGWAYPTTSEASCATRSNTCVFFSPRTHGLKLTS